MRRLTTTATLALVALGLLIPTGASAAFGFLPGGEGFEVKAIADGGAPAAAAGSHPYKLDFHLGLNQGGSGYPDGDIRNLSIELPAGLILNPSVLAKCTAAAFNASGR
jgi:hypothetical protein